MPRETSERILKWFPLLLQVITVGIMVGYFQGSVTGQFNLITQEFITQRALTNLSIEKTKHDLSVEIQAVRASTGSGAADIYRNKSDIAANATRILNIERGE